MFHRSRSSLFHRGAGSEIEEACQCAEVCCIVSPTLSHATHVEMKNAAALWPFWSSTCGDAVKYLAQHLGRAALAYWRKARSCVMEEGSTLACWKKASVRRPTGTPKFCARKYLPWHSAAEQVKTKASSCIAREEYFSRTCRAAFVQYR